MSHSGDIKKCPKRRGRRAFTLIEAMIVLGLSATLAGLGVTRYWSLKERAERRQQIQELMDVFQDARDMARTRLAPVDITPDGRVLLIESESGEQKEITLGSHIQSITIDSDDGILSFNSFGGTIYKDPIQITISADFGQDYYITIYPAIGSMRLST